MLRVFPDARLVTTVVRPEALPAEFGRAEASFLQHLPGATSYHEWLLPLMPAAWRMTELRDVDVVISSSHACANRGPRRARDSASQLLPHPMRYAWDFDSEAERFPGVVRPAARLGMAWFRRWDRRAATRIDRFLANSSAVAERIEHFYGREAAVVHPPVRTDYFTPNGDPRSGFLYVGRLVPYKRRISPWRPSADCRTS
jgi:glycosyltransferase involved in cell wall biosynthesis